MIPQPFTLAGRAGTIVYLDAQWHPVTPEQAVAARVLYDDGGTAFFVVEEKKKSAGVGGLTQKFDAALHPRGDDGRFVEATQPRIFNRPDEIGQVDGWPGEPVRFGWKDKETGKVTGRLLTGEPIPRENLPETLYHVTTAGPAVRSSGVLLGLLESGGLGGGQAEGVSFTTSPEDAVAIQRELVRAIQVARGDVGIEALEQWARADEKEAGLPEGALNRAVGFAMDGWEANKFIIDNDYEQGKGWTVPRPPEERERIRRGVVQDALRAYLQLREEVAAKALGQKEWPYNVPLMKNPYLLGNQAQLAKLKPEDVQTLEIPSAQIPAEALVTTGSDKFLHEVRAYSDVPLRRHSIAKAEAFEESEHPRHPGGSSEGGRFAETGRTGVPTSTPELAAQAKVGIAAVEKLLPEAIDTADYENLADPEDWDDVSSDVQDAIYDKWREDMYSNMDVDTSDLDAEVRKELEENNQAVLDKTFADTIKGLDKAFPDLSPTLPIEGGEAFSLQRVIDPDSFEYEEGDDEELATESLRFTNGLALTDEDQQRVRVLWSVMYRRAFDDALQKEYESEDYNEKRNELESDQIDQEWGDKSDSDKIQLAADYGVKLRGSVDPGRPDNWTTGVESGDHSDEDYARTHAIALRLTEIRTDEIRKERGLLETDQGEHLQPRKVLSSEALIETVWKQWKVSSSERLSLSLQLAIAQELGGVHRLSPEQVEEAKSYAIGVGGMDTLQAYVRAQWEVTQMVMEKAGETKVQVYRGLMLDGNEINKTSHQVLNSRGEVQAPKNVKTFDEPNPMVSFEFNGNTLVEPRRRRDAPDPQSILDLPPDATDFQKQLANIPPFESVEETVQRNVDGYARTQKNFEGVPFSGAGVKLPDLALQRAGAQSTTGTQQVANDWGGVGNLPPNPTRVVLRIEAPPTSVLSLPVYGQNAQEEHETVIIGMKDKWLWDTFRYKAPTFKLRPISDAAKKRETVRLVIDLQKEDNNRPHWMSTVDWTTVQKWDEAKHPRNPKGSGDKSGEFAGAGKMVYAPDPQFLATVKEHIETAFDSNYRELYDVRMASDQALDQIKARVTAVGRAMLARAVPTIRVPDFLAAKILEDGRFKSQHETGESTGMLDPEFRGQVEKAMFGTDPQGDVKDRPIYGAFMEDFAASRHTSQYGEVIFVLKDTILERTTVSFSDSLAGSDSKTIAPRPYREFDWVGVGDIGDQLTEENSVDRLYTYAEAQFHGGVTMDDVKEIVVPQSIYTHWGTYKPSLVKRFQDRGITVRVLAPKTHKARV